jgi:hypothetical protein
MSMFKKIFAMFTRSTAEQFKASSAEQSELARARAAQQQEYARQRARQQMEENKPMPEKHAPEETVKLPEDWEAHKEGDGDEQAA